MRWLSVLLAGAALPAAPGRAQEAFSTSPSPVRGLQGPAATSRSGAGIGLQTSPAYGSVPAGKATPDTLDLTLDDALARALRYNLALTSGTENVQVQRAARLRALSFLLPNVVARPAISEQQVDLAAMGFTGFPGIPTVIGPFTVYDARAAATIPVLNFSALANYRAAGAAANAAEFSLRDVREQIVVLVSVLYLQAVAGNARVEAQRSQLVTAETAYRQAVDRRNAGTAPGIDVLRAQVEWQAEQQQLIFYEGEFEKQKLTLARAIGLPPGQQFRLADNPAYAPLPADVTLDATLEQAYRQRSDYRAAQEVVRASELSRNAARAGWLPSAGVDGNYGVIGQSPSAMHGSFTVAAAVTIPIFQGGRVRADVESADAMLRQRRAELEDLRGRIDAEVRTAFVDVTSASRQVEVAVQNVTLAQQQLQQAQDRFAAGVTNTLEVVQAQQAVALANENHIAALYAFNAAKAALLRARGDAGQNIRSFLRRTQ